MPFGNDSHPDRTAQSSFAVPEPGGRLFKTVPISITQQPDIAVVPQSVELSVASISNVVHVLQIDGQFVDRESRDKHLDWRWVGHSHKRFCVGSPSDIQRLRQPGAKVRMFSREVIADLSSFCVGQHTVVNDYLSQISVEKATNNVRLIRFIGVEPRSDRDVVHRQFTRDKFTFPFCFSIDNQSNLSSLRVRTTLDDAKLPKATRRFQQVPGTTESAAFEIEVIQL